jgi:hypothetical protein
MSQQANCHGFPTTGGRSTLGGATIDAAIVVTVTFTLMTVVPLRAADDGTTVHTEF